MPSTLIATPGDPNANSYLTVAEANAYFDDRLHTEDWNSASTDDRTRSLISATRELDARVDWLGSPATPGTQALAWPRVGVLERDTGIEFPPDEIPDWLKNGTAEYAIVLIRSDIGASTGRSVDRVETPALKIWYGSGQVVRGIPSSTVSYIDLYVKRWHGKMVRDLIRA